MNNSFSNIKTIAPKSFIESVAGSGRGYVTLSYTQDPKTKFLKSECFPASDRDLILDRAASLSKKSQVYFGINRRSHLLSIGERGGNGDVGNISIIGMDIDVSDPKEPDKELPQSQEEALTLLETFTLKPSFTISSGVGVHAYWALNEEIEITNDQERKDAQELVRSFYRGFAQFAHPFKFDSTHDLSRMLRFPGSWNFKDPENPRQVVFLSENPERTYSISEIKGVGIAKPTSSPKQSLQIKPGAMSLSKVSKGCSWVNNALVNPRSVKYPEWFAVASILYFADDGRARFHEWSKKHPDYDAAETDALFDQVEPEKAKRTCESIASSLHGANHCNQCPFRGGINSPVDLGLPGKRYIVSNSGDLPTKTAQAWSAVYVANEPPRIFRNKTGILRINPGDVGWDLLDSKSARHEFARIADWVRPSSKGLTPADPQQMVIDDLLETINPPLPYLKKVTTIPVITSDGRLVSAFGYDADSQIYRVRSLDLSRLDLGEKSRFKDAAEAASFILDDCLHDFPLATKQDKAHALALMLHDFARNLFTGPSPFFLLDKPIHGSGATLLATVLCYPSMGSSVPTKVFSNNEEEVRKQITSHLMSGGGPYLFDNLPDDRKIDSDVLASVVTSTIYSDRALGTNNDVKLENLGPWIATGNNPDFSGQLKRRVIRARLIPDTDEPYLRENFLHNPLMKWVQENRADLVDACLTIVMSWINAGRPAWHGQPLGSFEEFSKVMGGILQNAGVEGFMTDMDYQKDSVNSDTEQVRDLIQEWWKTNQNANLTATQIVEIANVADLDIQDKWFDIKPRAQVSNAGKLLKSLLDRHFTIETPSGRKNIQLILGGTKHTYRLKEKIKEV
jgi:hypothetical protein